MRRIQNYDLFLDDEPTQRITDYEIFMDGVVENDSDIVFWQRAILETASLNKKFIVAIFLPKMGGGKMPTEIFLDRAQKTADAIIKRLAPYCKKIEVAGSIRRRRPRVHDVDIVLIPKDPWGMQGEILKMGPMKMSGAKLSRVLLGDIQVDFYFATEETWATLLLIRTGSIENNIRLCSIAKKKGWRLYADGRGLENEKGKRIAGDTELSIYQALGLPYQKPEDRN